MNVYMPASSNRVEITACPMCQQERRHFPCECGCSILGINAKGNVICKRGKKLYLRPMPKQIVYENCDLCFNVTCPDGESCNPYTGACEQSIALRPEQFMRMSKDPMYSDIVKDLKADKLEKFKYGGMVEKSENGVYTDKNGQILIVQDGRGYEATSTIVYEDWMFVPPITSAEYMRNYKP